MTYHSKRSVVITFLVECPAGHRLTLDRRQAPVQFEQMSIIRYTCKRCNEVFTVDVADEA